MACAELPGHARFRQVLPGPASIAFPAALLIALLTPDPAYPAASIRVATGAGCLAHSVKGDYHCSSLAEIKASRRAARPGA